MVAGKLWTHPGVSTYRYVDTGQYLQLYLGVWLHIQTGSCIPTRKGTNAINAVQ